MKLRRKNCFEFEASPGYVMRAYLKRKTKQKQKQPSELKKRKVALYQLVDLEMFKPKCFKSDLH